MTSDTKANIVAGVSTVGAATTAAATLGWKAAVIAGAGAFFGWLGGLFHTKPGKK